MIFVSSLDGEDDEVQAFVAGGVDFVNKPFRPETLLARVGTQIRVLALNRRVKALQAGRQ